MTQVYITNEMLLSLLLSPRQDSNDLYYSMQDTHKHRQYIPAPKVRLPGHSESYNPPPEYLPTEEEVWLRKCM